MTISEFKDKIAEVERFYQKEYVNEQKNELYKYFREHNIAQFNYVISKVYQKCKYLPAISEIIDIEKNIPFSKVKRENVINCPNCNNRGYILYHKVIKGIDYDFIAYCNCSDEYRYVGKNMKNPLNRQPFHTMSEAEAIALGFKKKII